jgi:hypothetical protein
MRKFDAINFGVNPQESCLLKTYDPFWKQNYQISIGIGRIP